MGRMLLLTLLLTVLATPAGATISVYYTFGEYDTVVNGEHSLFLDYETDKDGNTVTPSEDFDNNGLFDIEGHSFSYVLTYSSPDYPSSRVNIADIGEVENEIGPYNEWDGTLRWEYAECLHIATAFTGIEVDPTTQLRLYREGELVGSVQTGGTGAMYQFFGFVSSEPFDLAELDGIFFAIDAHYSTASGATPTIQTTWGSVKTLFAVCLP